MKAMRRFVFVLAIACAATAGGSLIGPLAT
jgi:hypothetical protein